MWAEYDNMTVESENNRYRLHVTGYYGNTGDAFNDDHPEYGYNGKSNGMQFSTFDIDNDEYGSGNCAAYFQSGWWYRSCTMSRLNGNPFWYSTLIGDLIPISASRMMLQCGDYYY